MKNTSILIRRFWIFDLDGTLTLPQHDFKAIKAELEIPPDADILLHLSQLSKQDALIKQKKLDEIEIGLASTAKPSVGAAELVRGLAEQGVHMGVLTRNSKTNAHVALEAIGLSQYFETLHVFGRDEVAPKPSPKGIYKLLHHWEADMGQALMVGDYLYDLQCARAAGVAAVHMDTTERFPWPEYTDLAVRDLSDLHQLLIRTIAF